MPRIRPMPTGQYTQLGTSILSDGTLDGSFRGKIRLNRSQKWPDAPTYQIARDMSPSNRPVR
jgi:hypothetical protein